MRCVTHSLNLKGLNIIEGDTQRQSRSRGAVAVPLKPMRNGEKTAAVGFDSHSRYSSLTILDFFHLQKPRRSPGLLLLY